MSDSNQDNPAPDEATRQMAALASDVCQLWQEHLSSLAADPAARAELARMLEPQRQAMTNLFADYSAMMQHGPHAKPSAHETATPAPAAQPQAAPAGPAPAAAASDDGALRVAQLAHRVAVLEERIAKLESRLAARARRSARQAPETSGDGDASV